jgi:hypothetical protein
VAVLAGQPEHASGGPQPEQGIDLQQPGDHLNTRGPDLTGLGAAPGRGAHLERDLLRWIVRQVGLLAHRFAAVGGDQLPGVEDLHHRRGLSGVHSAAEVPPGHRVQGLADLAWMSGPTLPTDHVASTKCVRGNGLSASASTAANTVAGAAPPNGRHDRAPATSRHHTSACSCICCGETNSRPRQNESRT